MTRIFGMTVVRDEADVVAVSLQHQLAAGMERIMVVDNGSTDGTRAILRRLSRTLPISWTAEDGGFRQAAHFTGMALEARAAGADWVVPFDADEFWQATPGNRLREILGYSHAASVRVSMVNFHQRRSQRRRSPYGLLTMTRRAGVPADTVDGIARVRAGEIGTFEIQWPSKVAIRPAPGMKIALGGHSATGLEGFEEATQGLEILHAPMRSRQCVERRAEKGARVRETHTGNDGWHFMRLADAGAHEREAEWIANSYGARGALRVGGADRPTVRDDRLRRVAAPWVLPLRRARAQRRVARWLAAG